MQHSSNIEVLTSNATHALLCALAQAFERQHPCAVAVQADSAKVMLSRIRDGERADLAVLNAPDIDELDRAGILDSATRRPFTRSRIGVAVRVGEPHPDISSVDAFRRMLLDARAIAHTVHGASGMYVPKLIERLGLAQRVRTVTRPGGLIAKVVAAGEADLALQQISELLAVEGVEIVGPLPQEIQMTFDSAVAIFRGAANASAADALMRFFWTPETAVVFETYGLERL